MTVSPDKAQIPDAAGVLIDFSPQHGYFVGIDSDGCAFDAMEIKHQECFTPNTIKHWGLQPIAKMAREAAVFVNLYSQMRGLNRWIALVAVMDVLARRKDVLERGFEVPRMEKVRAFIASGYPLSDQGIADYAAVNPDPELDTALAWGAGVNETIADMVKGVPPFPHVKASLEAMDGRVDLMVVSATPGEALEREWGEHGLAPHMAVIAGQEMGSKAQHLEFAAKGKYPDDRILLMGDAPGDREAARTTGVLYYPINPGYEEASWKRFLNEGLARFLDGTFAGAYQDGLIAEFEALLPANPPWETV